MVSTLLTTLAMASAVSAHATMYGIWINGQDQGDGRGKYIRSPPNNNPVKDLRSADINCNVNGGPVSDWVPVPAGATLSFEWYHDNRNDDIIDGSHKGPLITYITNSVDGNGSGGIWTKIAEDGYDGSSWAVDKIKANQGKQDFVLPASLAPGRYIIRQEILAHHESETSYESNPARGTQFYPSCVQVEVTGGGGATPPDSFDFNAGYSYQDPGILFNLYAGFSSYPIPGPAVWQG